VNGVTAVTPVTLRFGLYGLLLGFSLSRIGFSSFREVHRMFTFQDLRLLFAFAGGLALIAVVYFVTMRWQALPKAIHPGTVVGGVLFGIGWALTGGCPAVALVQLGEGRLAALATVLGIGVGTVAYPVVHRRWFRWDAGGCEL
jgi:uncharacterized membrane protein YedE/YeeE